jgi:cysteine synthase B
VVTASRNPCGTHSETRLFDDGILSHIGNTPLLRLRRIPLELNNPRIEIYAKAEWFNPGGSVKDRAALRIVEDAERSGALTPRKTLLDSTSGNTGIAYAMICAVKGYRCALVMPSNVSRERIRTVRAYGASVVFSDPLEGSDGALLLARELREKEPNDYYLPCQYDNDSNWLAHFDTTGVEILKQTGGRVTHFVAGVGTSGTVVGTGRRLKDFNEAIHVCSVEPDSGFHGLEGLKHIETSIVPGIYDASVLDRRLFVGTEDAYEMSRRLAVEEGMLVGKSSGAALVGAMQVARELDEGVLVVVFPDGGSRYLSTTLFE